MQPPSNVDNCAAEPIHIPGSIQPHGALWVLDSGMTQVLQASANADTVLGLDRNPAGRAALVAAIANAVPSHAAVSQQPVAPFEVTLSDRTVQVSLHAGAQGVLAEFEPASAIEAETFAQLYPSVRAFVDRLESAGDVAEVCQVAAAEVRRLTGFDRVLVYRFDRHWHGTVIAEDGNGTLPSYLDLRFPASDIPAQARALYRRNRLRLIPNARYVPVPVEPASSPVDGQPIDLSAASLRSVSPVHLQYMRNMGTDASMSISILVDEELWGLVSCHHAQARVLGPRLRSTCDFLGQLLSMQIGARERGAHADERLALGDIEHQLLARVSRASSLHTGLKEASAPWLALTGAEGAALVMDGAVMAVGRTPTPEQIEGLVAWLGVPRDEDGVVATDALAHDYAPAAAFADVAAGLVAVPVSAIHPHYVLWFRPEVVRTVRWGGEPAKAEGPDGQLHPRRSFAMWSEEVRGTSAPWTRAQVDAARSFMGAIVNYVLKRAEERAELTHKLEESNRELEAFSYSVSHDLRAPFRHVVGYAQLLREREDLLDDKARHYLTSIIESATAAGTLVDDLLNFSQLGRSRLDLARIDMNKLVAEIRRSYEIDGRGRQVEWVVGALPSAYGDATLVRQAMSNLVDNALKYTQGRSPAVIRIEGEERLHETVYAVRDNGVGFDMAYVGKLFGVFQRLHRAEDFEGTGIGLALARRIVDRHGGWIAAEGKLNEGATFRFGLPRKEGEPD